MSCKRNWKRFQRIKADRISMGDLPILGSILNIYDIQIDILKTINYEHLSHKNVKSKVKY